MNTSPPYYIFAAPYEINPQRARSLAQGFSPDNTISTRCATPQQRRGKQNEWGKSITRKAKTYAAKFHSGSKEHRKGRSASND
jgi:hypothetical protein